MPGDFTIDVNDVNDTAVPSVSTIPSGGSVRMSSATFTVPNPSSGSFTFSLSAGDLVRSLGTLTTAQTWLVTNGATVAVNGANASGTGTVTVSFTPSSGSITSTLFYVTQSGTSSSAGTTACQVTRSPQSQIYLNVTSLAQGVTCQGSDTAYETNQEGNYTLDFVGENGITFNPQPAGSAAPAAEFGPNFITYVLPSTGSTAPTSWSFVDTNSNQTQTTGFNIYTNEGVAGDPSIINNPDT